jgi:hypothetical protein
MPGDDSYSLVIGRAPIQHCHHILRLIEEVCLSWSALSTSTVPSEWSISVSQSRSSLGILWRNKYMKKWEYSCLLGHHCSKATNISEGFWVSSSSNWKFHFYTLIISKLVSSPADS